MAKKRPHATVATLDDGIEITRHALEQYITRYDKGANEAQAIANIRALLYNCTRGSNTVKGDKVLIPDDLPEARFVFKDDNVCITVLPASAAEKNHTEFDNLIREYIEENPDDYQKYVESLVKDKQYEKANSYAKERNILIDKYQKQILDFDGEIFVFDAELIALKEKKHELDAQKSSILNKRQVLINAIANMNSTLNKEKAEASEEREKARCS